MLEASKFCLNYTGKVYSRDEGACWTKALRETFMW